MCAEKSVVSYVATGDARATSSTTSPPYHDQRRQRGTGLRGWARLTEPTAQRYSNAATSSGSSTCASSDQASRTSATDVGTGAMPCAATVPGSSSKTATANSAASLITPYYVGAHTSKRLF